MLLGIGECGLWQISITLMLWLPAIIDGVMTLMASYTALVPQVYRCNIPECDGPAFGFKDFPKENLFPSFDKNSSEFNPNAPDFCSYYRPRPENGTCSSSKFSSDVVQCGSNSTFAYDEETFVMKTTLVTEFTLLHDW